MEILDIKILNLQLEKILMNAGFKVKRSGRLFHQFTNGNVEVTLPVANYDLNRHYIRIDHLDNPGNPDTFSFDINGEMEHAEQAIAFLQIHTFAESVNAL